MGHEMYCLKCRKKFNCDCATEVVDKRGRSAIKGKCQCGMGTFKYIKKQTK